jgi:hypothetical protein
MRESPLFMRLREKDSLLIRCSESKFSNFGHNSLLLGASSKTSLLFSLFFGLQGRRHTRRPPLCLVLPYQRSPSQLHPPGAELVWVSLDAKIYHRVALWE